MALTEHSIYLEHLWWRSAHALNRAQPSRMIRSLSKWCLSQSLKDIWEAARQWGRGQRCVELKAAWEERRSQWLSWCEILGADSMNRSEFRIAGTQSGRAVARGQQQPTEESGLCSEDKGKLLRHWGRHTWSLGMGEGSRGKSDFLFLCFFKTK